LHNTKEILIFPGEPPPSPEMTMVPNHEGVSFIEVTPFLRLSQVYIFVYLF